MGGKKLKKKEKEPIKQHLTWTKKKNNGGEDPITRGGDMPGAS